MDRFMTNDIVSELETDSKFVVAHWRWSYHIIPHLSLVQIVDRLINRSVFIMREIDVSLFVLSIIPKSSIINELLLLLVILLLNFEVGSINTWNSCLSMLLRVWKSSNFLKVYFNSGEDLSDTSFNDFSFCEWLL